MSWKYTLAVVTVRVDRHVKKLIRKHVRNFTQKTIICGFELDSNDDVNGCFDISKLSKTKQIVRNQTIFLSPSVNYSVILMI